MGVEVRVEVGVRVEGKVGLRASVRVRANLRDDAVDGRLTLTLTLTSKKGGWKGWLTCGITRWKVDSL